MVQWCRTPSLSARHVSHVVSVEECVTQTSASDRKLSGQGQVLRVFGCLVLSFVSAEVPIKKLPAVSTVSK